MQTLTTTQHDSMDGVVEATSKMEPGFNARAKQDPRYSSIILGDGGGGQVYAAKTVVQLPLFLCEGGATTYLGKGFGNKKIGMALCFAIRTGNPWGSKPQA